MTMRDSHFSSKISQWSTMKSIRISRSTPPASSGQSSVTKTCISRCLCCKGSTTKASAESIMWKLSETNFAGVGRVDDNTFAQGQRSVVRRVSGVRDSMDVEMHRSVSLPELDAHVIELVPLITEVCQSITEFVRVVFRVFDEATPYILRR